VEFSFGFAVDERVQAIVDLIPGQCWHPAIEDGDELGLTDRALMRAWLPRIGEFGLVNQRGAQLNGLADAISAVTGQVRFLAVRFLSRKQQDFAVLTDAKAGQSWSGGVRKMVRALRGSGRRS